ncbi:MAG: hypothetical protein KJ674_04590 [Nanoarchaeota archaeon]|nr:hypothetical protein [Nanoarchaeota archaeon]
MRTEQFKPHLSKIIEDVKSKKELKDLDEGFLGERVREIYKGKFNKKNKDYKKFFKEIRKKLRETYGGFKRVREERVEVYDKIFEITGRPKSVLDLGCGYHKFPFKDIEYYGCDIGKDYIDECNKHLKKNKIKGKCFVFDLLGDVKKLKKVDVVFIFKVLESLEVFEKDISKKIVKDLKCKYVVVSFAKKVLSDKGYIKKKGRKWFRILLNELKYEYKIFDYKDEIYFIIKK